MKPLDARRRPRPRRPLPFSVPGASGPRSLFCVDLRAVETAWSQRPIQDIRYASRGGRLGWMLAGLDLDPLRTLQRNASALGAERAQGLFDALCEELAEAVLHDVPQALCRSLLPLLAPHGSGECAFPGLGASSGPGGSDGAATGPALLIVTEGRIGAEAAAVALGRAVYPPGPLAPSEPRADSDGIDHALWSDVLAALLPMLEAVRDRSRSLLIES